MWVSVPTIAVIFGGRIVEIPATVSLEDSRHAYTRALLDALPRLDVRLLVVLRRALGDARPARGYPFRDPVLIPVHPGSPCSPMASGPCCLS